MAKVQELEAKLDAIGPVVDAIAADQAALKDEIGALKAQVHAGGTITEAQLESALQKATALEDRLKGIDASVDTGIPPTP